MNVLNFAGTLGASIKGVAAEFEKQYNVEINWGEGTGAVNTATVAGSVSNQIYDAAFVDIQSQYLGSEKGLWEKLNPDIVKTDDVYPGITAINDDAVPIGMIVTSLYYNTDVFTSEGWEPPHSFSDLLDPKYCGKVGILDINASYGLNVVLGLGGLTAADAKSGNLDEAWETGLKRLQDAKSCFPSIEASAAGLEQKMQTGQYVIGSTGGVRILPLIKAGVPLKAVVPDEGAFLTTSFVAPVKLAPNAKLAQELVAWFLRPDSQKTLMESALYGPTVKTVQVPADLVEDGVPNSETVVKFVISDPGTTTTNRSTWTDQYQRAFG